MLSESLRRRLGVKEAFLLGCAAWLALYYAPLFGEYLEAARGYSAPRNPNVSGENDIAPQEEWRSIKSEFFTIYYRADTDLKSVERRLRRGSFFFGGSSSGTLATSEENVADEMDTLFRKTEEVLGMYPAGVNISVRIFATQSELDDEYRRIFKKDSDMPSFYIHKYKTIYTTEKNIDDALMIHEMSHALVDHYFGVVPPEKIGEIIASYVEMHLEE